jgi:hypothetical protein
MSGAVIGQTIDTAVDFSPVRPVGIGRDHVLNSFRGE